VGFEYIQIDDGYQPAHGDWTNNDKFPHGLDWLADYIKDKGFIPGIWVAPFWVVPKAKNYKKHEDIILKLDENVYVWDISTQEARDWLRNTFSQIKAWGYDYVKIDFLLWAYNSLDDRANKYMTKTEAYREALKAIREGVGEDTFILGCGAPMLPSIGIVNGMRIGPDVSTDWHVILNCVNPTATRWFYHRKVWDNDPDCLVVREPLTEEQAKAWASLIAISGGMVLESDNMQELPAKRLEIVRKCMPPYGKAGIPLDLDETALPTKWLLTLDRQDAYIVGIFNWDDGRWEKLELDLDKILPVAGPFLVYNVWDEEFLGERSKFVFDMPPASCKVLAIVKKASHPVVLATNRHILAGAIDVDEVSWSRQNHTLAVRHKNVWNKKYTVTIWVPEGLHLEELDSPLKANVEKQGNIITLQFLRPRAEFSWSAKFTR